MARKNRKVENYGKVIYHQDKYFVQHDPSSLWHFLRHIDLDHARTLCGSMDEIADRLVTMFGALDAPLDDVEVIKQSDSFHQWVRILYDEISDMYKASLALQKGKNDAFFDYWFNGSRPYNHPVNGGRLRDSIVRDVTSKKDDEEI